MTRYHGNYGSAVFAGVTSDRPTDRPTDHATQSVTIGRIYVRSTAMRPSLRRCKFRRRLTPAYEIRYIRCRYDADVGRESNCNVQGTSSYIIKTDSECSYRRK